MSSKGRSPEQWEKLLDENHIVFVRPINPEKWPDEYKEVFGVIRAIGRKWMQDHVRENECDILPLRQMQARVSKLVNAARSCLTAFRDEDDWRGETEDQVLSRFRSALICRSCPNYLWLSEFETMAEDEQAAERQRHRRSKRRLCHCTILDRSAADIGDEGRQPLFTSIRTPGIKYNDSDGHQGENLPRKQRPDRVIGLNVTKTVKERMVSDSSRTNTNALSLGSDIVYPFLVLEAKREKGPGPGFTGIEHQTALPIRIFLKEQQDLRQETGVALKCLVWFFAFRGEEWRLYGAVPEGDQTRIFDLWHGTMLSADGALQLCLIVDYIGMWARTTYREQVLAGLAAKSGLRRRFTAPPPSQVSDAAINSRWESESFASRWKAVKPGFVNGNVPESSPDPFLEDMTMTNGHLDLGNHSQQVIEGQEDAYGWMRFIGSGRNSPPWTRVGTIRHASLVQLVFQELNLPSDGEALRKCLAICFPEKDMKVAARRLLATVHLSGVCFAASKQGEALKVNDPHARVREFVCLRTQLRPEDWQMERSVLRVTCTIKAAQALSRIAEGALVDFESPDTWHEHECRCLLQELDRFMLLSGRYGASLAMSSSSERQMCFKLYQDHEGVEHFRAQGFRAGENGQLGPKDLLSIRKAIAEGKGLERHIKQHRTPFRVPFQATIENPLEATPEHPTLGEEAPCRLIRKPLHWPESTPRFCLLTLGEEIDFGDEANLGEMIKHLVNRDEPDIFGGQGDKKEHDPRDTSFFDRWIRVLQGELPSGTPFDF